MEERELYSIPRSLLNLPNTGGRQATSRGPREGRRPPRECNSACNWPRRLERHLKAWNGIALLRCWIDGLATPPRSLHLAPRSSMKRHVPVTMGSPRFRTAETGLCTVTDAWFPPNSVLERHTHARAIFAIMLAGSFTNRIVGRDFDCMGASFWTEPLGEPHANRGGTAGARVFVIQPDNDKSAEFAPFAGLLGEVSYGRHGTLALDGRRVLAEIGSRDQLAALAIDSGVMQMLIAAARLTGSKTNRHHAPPPRWVQQARDYVHEHFRKSFRLSDVAALVGVQPARLAQVFRRFYGSSMGEYARAQRLSWALEQLQHTDASIATVAVAAGYCDQSHLTREVKRALGVGAAGYRQRWRSEAGPRSSEDS